ncbi:MAG: hypothetical protein IAC13_03145 [Firmicutes bacterium]|uniref:Uncharacterized protein n=1 Tax=Candidatus Scybalomonas excrementavium TaxID=2840943 RepID=A0A9D9I0N1_9FIRM|nr:hypothetical protein [Candidatus Scybalomonas excrementavium]
MEDFFECVIGFNIYTYGGNIFYISYQWIMILALPLILSYNKRKGKSMKFLFYFLYIIHIIILYLIKQLLY